MTAEELGRRLLGECREEGLDEVGASKVFEEWKENPILQYFRASNNNLSSNWFKVPQLDRLIDCVKEASHKPSLHEQSRLSIQAQRTKSPGPVIEITSAGPAQGKTHLLYYLTALAVLPKKIGKFRLNASGSAVVVLDTDGRFYVPRLAEIMRHVILHRREEAPSPIRGESNSGAAQVISEPDVKTLLRESLQHVHIFHPQSFEDLVATLQSLPAYLFDSNVHKSGNRALHSIILDSASAFFWQVSAAEDEARLESTPNIGSKITTASDAYVELVQTLRGLQSTFSCAVVATSWSFSNMQLATPSKSPSLRPYPPAAWLNFPTLRLAVARDAVPPFAPGMSLADALRDVDARQKEVELGKFSAWVVSFNANGWEERVQEELRRRKGVESFPFRITNEGVEVNKDERDV